MHKQQQKVTLPHKPIFNVVWVVYFILCIYVCFDHVNIEYE